MVSDVHLFNFLKSSSKNILTLGKGRCVLSCFSQSLSRETRKLITHIKSSVHYKHITLCPCLRKFDYLMYSDYWLLYLKKRSWWWWVFNIFLFFLLTSPLRQLHLSCVWFSFFYPSMGQCDSFPFGPRFLLFYQKGTGSVPNRSLMPKINWFRA